ncbi:MAG: sulfatase-like hydrolase/transferase [Planctomycetota bacterium]
MPLPRNILFICSDQQRFDSLGCNGTPHARTPHLDRLASTGINFQNHFVANPVCSPSRGCIITGQHITEHGLWANGCTLPTHHPTIPGVLRQAANYQTAHFGKLHLEPIIRRIAPHAPYGFETCSVSEGDQQLLDDDHFRWLRTQHPDTFVQALEQMYTQGHAKAYTSCLPEPLTHSAFVTRQAIDWMQQDRDNDRPFYLSVGYFDPHHAFNPCEPYASDFADVDCGEPLVDEAAIKSKPPLYQQAYNMSRVVREDPEKLAAIRQAYAAMCAHIDDCVGRLLTTLDKLGLAHNTLVVFTSDHGEMLGEHGLLWKGPWMLDDLLRVPLIMNIPGDPLGQHNETVLTSAVDFFATFQAIAGIDDEYAEPSSGRPLLDHTLSRFPQGQHNYILAEWEHPKRQDATSLRCIRTATHKLVHHANSNTGEFYCLDDDPHEQTNRYHDPTAVDARDDLYHTLHDHYLTRRPHPKHLGGW